MAYNYKKQICLQVLIIVEEWKQKAGRFPQKLATRLKFVCCLRSVERIPVTVFRKCWHLLKELWDRKRENWRTVLTNKKVVLKKNTRKVVLKKTQVKKNIRTVASYNDITKIFSKLKGWPSQSLINQSFFIFRELLRSVQSHGFSLALVIAHVCYLLRKSVFVTPLPNADFLSSDWLMRLWGGQPFSFENFE